MAGMDIYERSLKRHREARGKVEIRSRMPLNSREDLSLAYTPGVARPCEVIAEDVTQAWDLTWKGRTVAVISDGTAVLGLGDIGPEAALPVMEGKAVLFREFAGIDAVPLVIRARDVDEVVNLVKSVAPTFGGINLEDFSAPRCFDIEARLQDIGIPVLHDDQHGTAVVTLAAIKNALRILNKEFKDLNVVINGAGAAGRAIGRLLSSTAAEEADLRAGNVCICDSKGIIWPGRPGNTSFKEEMAQTTNPERRKGDLREALRGANVFIGVSKGHLLEAEDIKTMDRDAIVLAMANPIPEIHPEAALKGGAAIVGTGRSDYANQVNNVLAFPGLFRGALQARAPRFTRQMLLAAVDAIADCVSDPRPEFILPEALDRSVAPQVAKRVAQAAQAG
ncbi:MAG TPA: NADP-dependent malic enzyme [Acidobacteriota bacterium]|nr:NADP-dependent malic enzyme [Acidobacteriota bacterium]